MRSSKMRAAVATLALAGSLISAPAEAQRFQGRLPGFRPGFSFVTAVAPPSPLSISGTPGAGVQNSAYSFTPTTAGGAGTKSFSVAGTLPAGLSLSTASGQIAGTPTTQGTSTGLTEMVTDASGSATLGPFSITVNSATAAARSFTDSFSSTASTTSYAKTGAAVGTADPSRIVVIAIAARASTAQSVSGVTVGGATAAKAIEYQSNGNTASIWYVALPSGTTADVAVTWGGAVVRGGFSVYSVTGASGVGVTTSGTGGGQAGGTLSLPYTASANGVVIVSDMQFPNGNAQRAETASATISAGSNSVGITASTTTGASTFTGATLDQSSQVSSTSLGAQTVAALVTFQ